MKAKDLMIPIQEYLRPDSTIKEAVNLLKTAKRGEERIGVKGLPVLDESGKLMGILSMRDILKAVHPTYMDLMNVGGFTWEGMLEEMAKKIADKKVFTLMTRDVMTVKEDAPLMDAVDHMIRKNVKRLPVVDKTGKVVGMLYERDIFFAIVKTMLEENTGGVK
jgi:CBS domain-containing protein